MTSTPPNSPRGPLAEWFALAEAGEPFDSYAERGSGRTRARFDGRQLVLGHWHGPDPVALLEMRLAPDGQWMARLAPCAISRTHPADKEARALALIEEAFQALPPCEPCGLARRILWPR